MEGDLWWLVISIHALQAECDVIGRKRHTKYKFAFLSTHSKRSATYLQQFKYKQRTYFYPRTPSGVRRLAETSVCDNDGISIHALQAECDVTLDYYPAVVVISIHALQAECDCAPHTTLSSFCYFYPRTPSGVRLVKAARKEEEVLISIHALQAECDCSQCYHRAYSRYFYPRTPSGVRRHFGLLSCRRCYFYPRTPSGVRLEYRVYISTTDTISIHALQAECDR